MKKLLLFLFLFSIGISSVSAQNSEEAVAYLEQLTNGQKDISEQLMRYISVNAHSKNTARIERKRQKLVKATEKVRDNVMASDNFYDDSSLRDSMLEYINLSYQSLVGDYKEIAAMKDKANSDYEAMKALLEAEERANQQLDIAQAKFEKQVEAFTGKYNINLVKEDNSLSDMITQSNEVAKYYNTIFLPMFKVNLQNIHLKEMMATNDIDKIEEARKTTEVYAEEARAALSSLQAFNGDNSLLEGAKLRVDFYVEEANLMAFNTIEYVKLNEQLQEQKVKLDKTKPQKRTKKMVDEYNGLVNEVNKLANTLNLNANQLNQTSQLELIQWEQLVKQFRQRHIPKYGLYDLES